MIVSHEKRVLFVHVQKTGGSSVDATLGAVLPDAERVKGLPGTRHAKLRSALRAHPELSEYFCFGFVRNPWARLLSWHEMVMRRARAAAQGEEFVRRRFEANTFWQQVSRDYPDFEGFVLRGTREIGRVGTPQLDWLRAPGRPADFVGRTERLEEDLRAALEQAGVPLPEGVLERRNAGGPRTDYRSAYTPQMAERVAEVFAEDIAAFDYSF